MSTRKTPPPPRTQRALRKGIILDRVNPQDFQQVAMTFACEHCVHFKRADESCTFGFIAEQHLLRHQLRLYNLTGRMAFCRYLEID